MEHMTLYRIVYTCLYTCLMSHVCRVSYTPVRFTRGYNSTVYRVLVMPHAALFHREGVHIPYVESPHQGKRRGVSSQIGGKLVNYIVILFFDPPLPCVVSKQKRCTTRRPRTQRPCRRDKQASQV